MYKHHLDVSVRKFDLKIGGVGGVVVSASDSSFDRISAPEFDSPPTSLVQIVSLYELLVEWKLQF